jgi:hypothetical protein
VESKEGPDLVVRERERRGNFFIVVNDFVEEEEEIWVHSKKRGTH